MPKAPYSKDSVEKTIEKGLELAAMVNAEPEVASLARESLEEIENLELASARRRDAADALIMARGPLTAAARQTDRALVAFAKMLAGATSTPRQRGERSAEYGFVMNGGRASAVLAGGRAERNEAIAALRRRIEDGARAGSAAVLLAGGLFTALDRERAAAREHEERRRALSLAAEQEEAARLRVVAAVRAMIGQVHAHFSERPEDVREVLGHGNPARTRRANLARAAGAGDAEEAEALAGEALAEEAVAGPALAG